MTRSHTDTLQLTRGATATRWRVFGTTFAIVGVLMSLWSFATPLMAVPDEPAHAIRAAAVARGEITAPPSPTVPWQLEVHVPRYVAHTASLTCFAFDPSQSASCQPALTGDPNEIVAAPTSAGINSPIYYALVGWPTLLLSGDAALYAMRIVSALLSAALFAVAVSSLSQLSRGRWTYAAAAAAVTPMLLFLGGSINPNAVEITAAAALFTSLALVLRRPSPGALLWERAALVVASSWLLVNTRNIALLWLAIIVGVAFVLCDTDVVKGLFKRVATWVTIALAGASAFAALYWFTRPQPAIPEDQLPVYPGMGGSFVTGVQLMIDRTWDYIGAWIGLFGWIDQPAPTLAVVIWTSVFAVLILGAIVLARGRARWATILLAAASLVVPPISQGILLADYGIIWQGRYMMAIYTIVLLAAAIALNEIPQKPANPAIGKLLAVAVWALALGHVVTFVWVLRRYVIGFGSWIDMVRIPEWQPPGTWIGLTVLFTATVAVAAVIVLRAIRRSAEPAPSEPAPSELATARA